MWIDDDCTVACFKLGFLLRIDVRIPNRPFGRIRWVFGIKDQSCQAFDVLHELLVPQFSPFEHRPPFWLGAAAMKVEELEGKFAQVFGWSPPRAVNGQWLYELQTVL